MNYIIQILTLFPMITFGQSFQLTDTVFKTGDIYRTYEIKYDLAKPWICAESNLHLDSIAVLMLKNQNIIFEIGVHCDSKWLDAYSECLTCRRADAIKDYLVEKGVNPIQILTKGYNESQLIISDEEISKMETIEEKEIAHLKNRRTEIKILKIN